MTMLTIFTTLLEEGYFYLSNDLEVGLWFCVPELTSRIFLTIAHGQYGPICRLNMCNTAYSKCMIF